MLCRSRVLIILCSSFYLSRSFVRSFSSFSEGLHYLQIGLAFYIGTRVITRAGKGGGANDLMTTKHR